MAPERALVVERAAQRVAREPGAPLLVAVSGGLDSMVLLHALASAGARIAAVATFDHRTGPAAAKAVAHVRRAARALGIPVIVGRAGAALDFREGREAAWREARYAFLRAEAAVRGARVVTAHTEDDQVETVLMRVMRGSGARGMAGLYAGSETLRPFLRIRRAAIQRYASKHDIAWSEDPSNQTREFLRNRVRMDLLPALRRVSPNIDAQLLALAERAATLRREVDGVIDAHLDLQTEPNQRLTVGAGELAALDGDSLMVVWSALAGRIGLSLDRRGTRRIGEFTMKQPRSGWIPLRGGWQLEAQRGRYRLYRSSVDSGNKPQVRGNRSVRQTGTALLP
jgi:tRNA(Ile)-lysidine synthase